jgi:3-oxoacyl-[acyl-carrier protein] reductase
MDLGIRGKNALVAAASKGIGKATAMGLAQEGVNVCICSRSQENIEAAAEEIRAATDVTVECIAADVSQTGDCDTAARHAINKLGGVDILVNNAGGPPRGYFEQFDDADWQSAFEMNTMSAIRLSRAVLPHMHEQKWGRIINLTSISVKQPIPDLMLSNSVRAAVHGWAKSLADQVAGDNITVNNVCTGLILTDRTREGLAFASKESGRPEAEIQKEMEAKVPLGRYGQPEELADTAVFLASERAAYVTGVSILVDGGFYRGLM